MIDGFAILAIAIMTACLAYPLIRRFSASLSIAIGIVLVFIVEIIAIEFYFSPDPLSFPDNLAFNPIYLRTGDSIYTVFTAIFIHADFFHILFNAIALVFLGLMLEEKIGARKLIVIFVIAGIVGNIVYGIANLNQYSPAVGASGAISGILGGMLALFPRERVNFIIYFFPLRNVPIWMVVLIFLAIQLLFVLAPGARVAWQAHIGGLVAGLLFTPSIARFGLRGLEIRTGNTIDINKLAKTKEEREIAERIESESIPEIRKAWLEQFAKTAKCPICGSRMRAQRNGFKCRNNHRFKIGE